MSNDNTSSSDSSEYSLNFYENECEKLRKILLRKLTRGKLNTLHEKFKEENFLDKEKFIFLIQNAVFSDNPKYIECTSLLYSEIDCGRSVTWDKFLDFLITTPKPPEKLKLNVFAITNPPHVKRDTIVKIVLLETKKYFCYAILSKYGHVGIYDGNLNFLFSYQTIMCRADLERKEEEKRRRNRWITDAIFLPSVFMFVIVTSARSITIYDASNLKHIPLWLIISFPSSIQCLTHSACKQENSLTLYLGDEMGTVTSITFLKVKEGLLPKKQNDKLSIFYWNKLYNEKSLLIVSNPNVHSNNIKMIQYYQNSTLVTCSQDPKSSVVIRYIKCKLKSYVFQMKLGAISFSLSTSIKLMVTGSDDGVIRLWSTTNVVTPLSIFKEHQTGVIDLEIFETYKVFTSYSKDGIVKMWDIQEEELIQSMEISFPSFKILGNLIEWGTKSIFPGPKRRMHNEEEDLNESDFEIFTASRVSSRTDHFNSSNDPWIRSNFLVTCCNYLSVIKLDSKKTSGTESAVLPPPPLQHAVLIPKEWAVLSNELQVRTNYAEDVHEDSISVSLNSLDFILNRDLLSEMKLQSDIHKKLAMIEETKKKMAKAVQNCAPYLALELAPIKEIKINENLPIPNDKKTERLVENTQRILSAASSRTLVFSESTPTTKTKSSRSSIVSFE